MNCTKTAEVMAAATPTLMSWPRDEAVTKVMPMDRITNSEAPKRMFGIFPYRAPLMIRMLK